MSPYLASEQFLGEMEIVSWLEPDDATPIALCRRLGSTRLCVAKTLFPRLKQDERALARFCNEIYLHSQVRHRNVVRSFEYIRGDGFLGYTMEYVAGGTLASLIERKSVFSIREALALLLDIASGLKAVHDAGIVHCDVKPENVLLTLSGRAKVSDLGIAQPHVFGGEPDAAVTGSLEYMSPEQLVSGRCDVRGDVYSLGLVAYELLAGARPFSSVCAREGLRHRLHQDPPSLSDIRGETPSWLDRLVAAMMNRTAALRPQSMNEVIHTIRRGRALQKARSANARQLA